MAERRRYTRREKVIAITSALAKSQVAVAQEKGIPETTLSYWMHSPEFADLRTKTRQELAEGSMVLAQLAQEAIAEKVRARQVEPRDLAVIYGIAIDKAQLLGGEATARLESRDLTRDDHESAILRDVLQEELAKRSEQRDSQAEAAGVAVAGDPPTEAGPA